MRCFQGRALERIVPFLALAAAVAVSCERRSRKETPAAPSVRARVICATTYPLAYFSERIGGASVEVVCHVPADEDPQFWRPDRPTVLAMQEADLIVMNGAGLEKWATCVCLPFARTVDTARPFSDSFIVLKDVMMHSHGPAGEHSHEGIDGYTWLDPVNAMTQAREIAGAMKRADVSWTREHEDELDAGLRSLIRDLKELDRRLAAVSEGLKRRVVLTSHPLYNYIARRYGWKIQSLLLEPDRMPSDAEFVSLKLTVEKTGAKDLLWEAQPPAAVVTEMKRRLGLTSVVFSPCATLADDDRAAGLDYLTVMQTNVENIRRAFASPATNKIH